MILNPFVFSNVQIFTGNINKGYSIDRKENKNYIIAVHVNYNNNYSTYNYGYILNNIQTSGEIYFYDGAFKMLTITYTLKMITLFSYLSNSSSYDYAICEY